MEEDVVEAVAAGELEPCPPVVVEGVAAEDQGAAGEGGRMFVDAKSDRLTGREAGSMAARGEPGKTGLFEQPERPVESAPRVGAGDVDLVRANGHGEGINQAGGGGEADHAGRARCGNARQVLAKFAGGLFQYWA